ncbi:hypothetical protein D3C84_966680 [compost metagenome]
MSIFCSEDRLEIANKLIDMANSGELIIHNSYIARKWLKAIAPDVDINRLTDNPGLTT